jgi:hypothetical protein
MIDEDKKLTRMEKIQVLLSEYNTLKTEIFEQSKAMYQVFGVGGTVSIAIIAFVFTNKSIVTIVFGGLLVFLLLFFMYSVSRMMTFIAYEANERLLEIEDLVNALAETKLLAWEHEHGIRTGMDDRRIAAILDPLKALYRRCCQVVAFRKSRSN